ncbi:response regulator [Oscillochloris sp. ZM17-4]|uniref:response regulator n=1 Tax=Oscillochloris sp. ZM17-4 TaxID=2866714 RepID=UPI00272E483A|nr:response regulator [Oscillochloris sp. ZM17-4]
MPMGDIFLLLSTVILLLIGGIHLYAWFWLRQDGAVIAQLLPPLWALIWALSWLVLITLILARRSAVQQEGQPPIDGTAEAAELRQQVDALERRVAERTAELQQANARLGEAARAAEEASMAQRQILADMSHDLRAPLNAILNLTRFLGKERYGTLSERQLDLQQRVLANAERMLGLINATLGYRAVEGGADMEPPPPAPGPPRPAPDAGRDAPPMVVIVDNDRSSQEICRLHLEPQGYAVTPVLDIRHAIERIRQIRPQLVILDVLMPHLNGWDVLGELKTSPDISPIPVLICSTADQQRLAITLGANDYLPKPIDGAALILRIRRLIEPLATILVIDDDPDAREIVRLSLDEQQCRVVEATDGRAGLASVESVRPDLIVLDLMMPGMDGIAVLERLRAEPRTARTPIMVLTAKELTASERAWLQARMICCVQKGQLSADQLRDQMTRLIRSSIVSL